MLKVSSAVFIGLLGLWGFSSTALADPITGEVGAGLSYQPTTLPAAATKHVPCPTWTWTGETSA